MRIPFFNRRPAPAPEAKSLAGARSWAEAVGLILPGGPGREGARPDALRCPAFGQGATLIAESVAAADILSGLDALDRPNPWTSWPELVRDMVLAALIYDEGALAFVTRRPGGEVLEVIQPPMGVMTVAHDPATGEPTYSHGGAPWPASDTIHIRPAAGVSAFSRARAAIGLLGDAEDFARRVFADMPGGVLAAPVGASQELVEKTAAALRDRRDGKTLLLFDGMSFQPIASTGVDAQLAEFRAAQVVEIARALNVPVTFLNDLSRATWSNLESKHREFVVITLEPWLRAIESELSFKLGSVVRFDRDDMTRADLQTRATTIASLIASEVINPNEGRAWLGMSPREGGDRFGNPHIGSAAGAAAPQDPQPEEAGE